MCLFDDLVVLGEPVADPHTFHHLILQLPLIEHHWILVIDLSGSHLTEKDVFLTLLIFIALVGH